MSLLPANRAECSILAAGQGAGYTAGMRTVSLLPAATEIVGVLGLMDQLVGVSHECNFPPEANDKPRVTACEIHGAQVASRDIDEWVNRKISQGEDLFTLDEKLLRELRP